MAVKALFQAGLVEQADRTAALFTRDGDQANNLFDMQHMWYELAAGRAHAAAGRHGPALKKLTAVVRGGGWRWPLLGCSCAAAGTELPGARRLSLAPPGAGVRPWP